MKKRFTLTVVMLLVFMSLLIVACAPKQADPNAERLDAVVPTAPAWSLTSNCAGCHATEDGSAATATAGYSYHVDQPNVECATCHSDADGALSAVHGDGYATAKLPTKLKDSGVSNESCLTSGCHDKEEIKAATAELTLLTDNKGKVVNPHDMTPSADHNLVTCVSCHEQHTGATVEETAPANCLTCHHKGSYECGTCH